MEIYRTLATYAKCRHHGGTNYYASDLSGAIPSLVRVYPKYSVSKALNFYLLAFIFNRAPHSLVNTILSFSRSSLKLAFEMIKRSSKYVLTKSKAAISSDILD